MAKPGVLLLNPPGDKLYIRDYYCSFSSKADYYWPPQDLIALSGVLDAAFDVQVIDAIVPAVPADDALRRVVEKRPRAVIFTTGTATLKSDLALMERIKAALPDVKVVASAVTSINLRDWRWGLRLRLSSLARAISLSIKGSTDEIPSPVQWEIIPTRWFRFFSMKPPAGTLFSPLPFVLKISFRISST